MAGIPMSLSPTKGSSTAAMLSRLSGSGNAAAPLLTGKQSEVREKFQDFVGGTFYKEMLKALRSGQKPPKYLYGKQAEEMFRAQLDQQIAEDMARQHGQAIAGPLFDAFARESGTSGPSPQPGLEGAHALDVAA